MPIASLWHCDGLNQLARAISDYRELKGFKTEPDNVFSKLMLVVSELGEACEEARKPDWCYNQSSPDPQTGKPEGFASEIADAIIRLLDISGAFGIDIELEIEKKMHYNVTRPYLHGKTV